MAGSYLAKCSNMGYTQLESDDSGGGDESVQLYLYPNDWNDKGIPPVREGAKSFCDQLIDNGIIGSYEVNVSYEYPGVKKGAAAEDSWEAWKNYDGPNNRENITGCHILVYQTNLAPSNGYADVIFSGKGAFANSQDCIVVQSSQTSPAATKNITIHEIAHTFTVDDGSTEYLGDSDSSDAVDHELGQVYPGWAGDGPISPMSTGYEDSDGREGECSNDAPWNFSYEETLSPCAKEAIEHTANQ